MSKEEYDNLVRDAMRFRSKQLQSVLTAVVEGFKSDPGTSDLDNEQPIHVRMTLGDWRKAVQLRLQG